MLPYKKVLLLVPLISAFYSFSAFAGYHPDNDDLGCCLECGTCNPDAGEGPGAPDIQPSPPNRPGSIGNPIRVISGNKYQSEVVFTGGGDFPLQFKWSYNSLYKDRDSVPNTTVRRGLWTYSYSQKVLITVATNGDIVYQVRRDDGRSIFYHEFASNPGVIVKRYDDPEGTFRKIVTGASPNEVVTYEYETLNGVVSVFNDAGVLIQLRNPVGLVQTITHGINSQNNHQMVVTDSHGTSLTIDFVDSTDSRPEKITTQNNTIYEFTYVTKSGFSMLASIIWPNYLSQSSSTSFVYLSSSDIAAFPEGACAQDWICETALTGVLDENGDRYATWNYVASGRAWESFHGVNTEKRDQVSFDLTNIDDVYNDGYNTHPVTIYNEYGQEKTYIHTTFNSGITGYDHRAVLTSINASPVTNVSYSASYFTNGWNEWNATRSTAGNLTSIKHGSYEDLYGYDSLGRVTSIRKKDMQTDYSWDPAFYRVTKIKLKNLTGSPNVLETTYSYNAAGRLSNVTSQDQWCFLSSYGSANAWYPCQEQITTYAYTYYDTAQTQVHTMTVDGPRPGNADSTIYEYTQEGYLKKITNALAQVTEYGNFNDHGQPGTVTDPNGVVATMTYAPRGWLTSVTVGSATTSYEYYPTGLLKKVTSPDGDWMQYEYTSAHVLKKITNQKSETIEISHSIDRDVAHTETISRVIKDAQGSVVQSSSRVYDAMGRLYQEKNSASTVLAEYNYSDRYFDMLSEIKRYGHANGTILTKYELDSYGRVTKEHLPRFSSQSPSQYMRLGYENGRLSTISVVNDDGASEAGLKTAYGFYYDGYGRLIEDLNFETCNQAQCYPGASNPLTTHYQYDEAGNITRRVKLRSTSDSNEIRTYYEYDDMNRLKRMGQWDGAATPVQLVWTHEWFYDSDDPEHENSIGRLSYVTDPSGRTDYSYDARGNLVSEKRQMTAGGNTVTLTTAYAYTLGGKLSQVIYPGGRVVDYTRSNGDVSSLAVRPDINSASRTLYSNVAYQPFGGWDQFDLPEFGASRIVRDFDQDGHLSAWRVVDASTVDPQPDIVHAYSYDPFNNITSITYSDASSRNRSYAYDEQQRLIQAVDQNGQWEYSYGSLGARTGRTLKRPDPSNGNALAVVLQEVYNYTYKKLTSVNRTVNQVPCDPNNQDRINANVPCSTSETRNITYDIRGNMVSDDRGADPGISLQYDLYGRLKNVTPAN